jgi:hypothetical protein
MKNLIESIKGAKKLISEKTVSKIKKRVTEWPDGTKQTDEDLSWEEKE